MSNGRRSFDHSHLIKRGENEPVEVVGISEGFNQILKFDQYTIESCFVDHRDGDHARCTLR